MRKYERFNIEEIVKALKSGRTSIFLGAGISFHSGIPIAKSTIEYILENLSASKEEKDIILNSELPFERFMGFLKEHTELSKLQDIFNIGEPNSNHFFIAHLVKKGYLKTICTTNFDLLIEKAFKESVGLKEGNDYKVFSNDTEFDNINWNGECARLIHIHGSMRDKTEIDLTLDQVANNAFSEQRKNIINNVFTKKTHQNALVLGYSCSDLFDISPQIESIHENNNIVYFVEHNKSIKEIESFQVVKNKNPFKNFYDSYHVICNTDKL